MKKAILFLLLLLTSTSFAQQKSKLNIRINYNVELLGLAYLIGFEGVDIEKKTVAVDGKRVPKKEWHSYGYSIYEKYKQYAASENLAKSFSVGGHLWLDYIINFLLQVDDFPNARLTPDINLSSYIGFSTKKDSAEARKNAVTFLEGLNSFYTEVNFKDYISSTKEFYDTAISEVKANLPQVDFIKTMETFYNKSFYSYTMIPSLTIPKGMGFGLSYTRNGKTLLFNVFGAFTYQQIQRTPMLDMGFKHPQRLRELSIHEFGHSFVNPVVNSIPAEKITSTAYLFDSIKSKMSDQGYNTWKACLYEHFVRAGEVVIARLLNDQAGSERLYAEYINDRKFIYLPAIITELETVSKNHPFNSKILISAMDKLKPQ